MNIVDVIKHYSAKNSKTNVAIQYNYSLKWKLFGYRLNKNPFFNLFKKISQNDFCPFCNEQLEGKICLHHIDYNHICQRGENIKIVKNMPNCEECFKDNYNYFISCSVKTILVHNKCHGKLHNKNKLKENRKIKKIDTKETKNINVKINGTHSNAYNPWTKNDDEKLELLFSEGKKVNELTNIFERKPGAIRSRIKKLELREKYKS